MIHSAVVKIGIDSLHSYGEGLLPHSGGGIYGIICFVFDDSNHESLV